MRKKKSKAKSRTFVIYAFTSSVGVALAFAVYFWWSNISREFASVLQPHAIAAKCGFVMKDVVVFGRFRTNSDDVLAAVGVTAGQSIFLCNLKEIQQRLLKLAWVREASVRRSISGELYIFITEREPIAIYHSGQKFYLVDKNGSLMDTRIEPCFRGLPILSGANAEKAACGILQKLHAYKLVRANISAMQLVQERRWNLKLNNGVEVKLPAQNVDRALRVLEKLIRDGQASSGDIRVIDLRFGSKLILKYSDSGKAYLNALKKTKSV
ncbi:MAG: cell division protein FtsQ/DivIB [Holosporales bacterium]|jgi:cell division protein FtsQ|nr:cell division protein FtsQ/DivIB [Holosporales bacterium]